MVTRRTFLKAAGAAGIVAAGGLGGPGPAQAARTFTFCSWGGGLSQMERQAFMDPAGEKLGVPITCTSPISYTRIKMMVDAGAPQWDLVDVGGQFLYLGRDQNLLEPLDFSVIDASHLDKRWVMDCGIYTSTNATVIAYDTRAFPDGKGPQSWAEFWDVRSFPGPRALYGSLYYNYEAALLAGGVKRDEVYPATDEKMKLAFAKLAEIKPHVRTWWTTGAQTRELLTSGEAVMGSAWSGRVLDAMKDKAPIAFTYKDAIAWGNAFAVPRGAPYKDLAMRIINYAISEEAQLRLLPLGTYGPVLASAAAQATPEEARRFVTYPDNLREALIFNDEEVAKYVAAYGAEWKAFRLS